MKVPTILNAPRNAPQLSVGGVGSGADARGTSEIGASISRLTTALSEAAKKTKDEQQALDKFELNQTFLQEANASAMDFKTAQETAPAGAPDFAIGWNATQVDRHKKLVDEMAGYGYKPDELHTFDLQLNELRNQQTGQALTFQNQQEGLKAESDVNQTTKDLSQYYLNNPMATESVKQELHTQIWSHPHIDEGSKQALFDAKWDEIRTTGAEALAASDPAAVIHALDPQGKYKARFNPDGTVPAAVGGAATGGRPSGYQGTAFDVAQHFNLNPNDVASIFSYETAGTLDPKKVGVAQSGSRKGQSFLGLIQFGEAERKQYKIDANSTPEQWSTAIIGYMTDRGFKPGMSMLDFYSTINAGKPGRYGASDNGGKDTVQSHYNRAIKEHGKRGADWYASAVPAETPAPSAFDQTDWSDVAPTDGAAPVTPETTALLTSDTGMEHKTGIAPLDVLTGPEQLKLLASSYSTTRQDLSEQRAQARVLHENIVAAGTQGVKPPANIPDEQGIALFGEATWTQMKGQEAAASAGGTFMTGLSTATPQAINAKLNALKPTDVNSPTYAVDLKNWEGARSAAQSNLAARETDPYSYAASNFPAVQKAFQNATTTSGRKAAYASLYAAYDTMNVPDAQRLPMSKEAIASAAEAYKAMAPGERLNQLGTWLTEMGPNFRHFAGYSSTTANAVGVDSFMFSRFYDHPNFRPVMGELMLGEQRIDKDPALKPQPEAINRAFVGNKGLRSTILNLNPVASKMYNAAVAAIYVGKGGGTQSAGMSGATLTDPKLYEESMRVAFGGLPNRPDTGLVQLHGGNNPYTILPPTVTKDEWNGWVQSLTPQSLYAAAVEKSGALNAYGQPVLMRDIKDQGVFVMTAPGYYSVISPQDNAPLRTKTGKLYLLHLTPEMVRAAHTQQVNLDNYTMPSIGSSN